MNDVYHSLRAEGIQFPNPQKPKKEFSQVNINNKLNHFLFYFFKYFLKEKQK